MSPRRLLLFYCLFLLGGPSASRAAATDDVLALFHTSRLVLLGERHWSAQDHRFRVDLVRHPDFPQLVDDVVVEFASSRFQPLLDRWILDLEELPRAELAPIWRDTKTTTGAWDSPIYEEFLIAVRARNAGLPRGDRIRVVGAALPVPWEKVQVWEDLLPYRERGWHAVRCIEREVLDRGRRGLVIFGMGHFPRVDAEMDEDDNITRRLMKLYPDLAFSVVVPFITNDGDPPEGVQNPERPALLHTASHPVGRWPAATFIWDGVQTLADTVDGLLWFGEEDERIPAPDDLSETDPDYARELERRRSLRPRI